MAAFCWATQYQALAQPMMRPAASSANVQEGGPAWCLSHQAPSSAPRSVGTATDQPIIPNMPSPNHALCAVRCAFCLRATRAAILASKSGSLSVMAQFRKPADETAFHLRNDGSHFTLLCVER